MGDKNDETKPRIENAINDAERAFWTAIEDEYSEVEAESTVRNTTEWAKMRHAMHDAVALWLLRNKPVTSPVTATAEIRIEMRPPKRGEMGYWAEALTAEGALAEVLRDSHDGLGWTADKDYEDRFDHNGLHAITVTVGKAAPALRMLTQDELAKAHGLTDAPLGTIAAGKPPTSGPVGGGWGSWVDALPEYKGWRATYDFPGYINWSHPDRSMFVCATPDFHVDGEIAIDIQDNYGRIYQLPDLKEDPSWPVSVRTPESYMLILGQILDKAFELPEPTRKHQGEASEEIPEGAVKDTGTYAGNDIFEDVVKAMQNAEEMGGPVGQFYLDLMTRIANEAMKRCRNYRMHLLSKAGAGRSDLVGIATSVVRSLEPAVIAAMTEDLKRTGCVDFVGVEERLGDVLEAQGREEQYDEAIVIARKIALDTISKKGGQ